MKSSSDSDPADVRASFWRALLHRWLVQYNPLYLLSAALVLGGTLLCSRGLAQEGSLYGPLGVAAIAEIYAAALIGGAALLMRIGYRRPAVMLSLLTVLYQLDLTLHTETCAYLGGLGAFATAAWLAVFIAKLYGLAWAMKLRLSRAALATALIGGFGLAVFPHYAARLSGPIAGGVIAGWIFALASLHRPGSVTTLERLDAWGATVLRRSVRAAWIICAVVLAAHVLFWSTQHTIRLDAVLAVVPLLLVRRIRSEVRVWAAAAGGLVVAAAFMPSSFFLAALLVAAALAVRALSPPAPAAEPARPDDPPAQPYRMYAPLAMPVEPPPAVTFTPVVVDRAERVRLLTGALFALHLSAWTFGWTGGDWPAHVAWLDAALTMVVLLVVWRAGARLALVPLAAGYVHLVVQLRLVPAPQSSLEWGAAAVGLGFVLLVASLVTSYRLHRASAIPPMPAALDPSCASPGSGSRTAP